MNGLFTEGVDVLVLHEDDAVRAKVADGIRETGCSVEEARNGDEAAIVMKLWPVRAVVVGPHTSGIDELLEVAEVSDPTVVIRLTQPS